MRKTKEQIEDDLQDVKDQAFLTQHSRPTRRSAAESLDQLRERLVRLLELARAGTKAVDPIARSFESGRVTGLEEAIELIDEALQAEGAARIKAAVQGRPLSRESRRSADERGETMSPEFMSAEEKASREELVKALNDILDSAGSLEELEKQEEKMKSAYRSYKLVTFHDPVWKYQRFKSRVSGDFVTNRRRVSLGTSPTLIDVRVYMKEKLGIDPQGV